MSAGGGPAAIARGSGADVVPQTREECAEPRRVGRGWSGGVGTVPLSAGGGGGRLCNQGRGSASKVEDTRCVQRVRTPGRFFSLPRDVPVTLG